MKPLAIARVVLDIARGPGGLRALAELARVNVREDRVPAYDLPALLTTASGKPVASASEWPARRAELLETFTREVYGPPPDGPELSAEVESERRVFGGRALRREVRLSATDRPERPALHLMLHLPADAAGPVPAFVGLNFRGNHSTHSDPAIRLSTAWVEAERGGGVVDQRATEAARGFRRSRWPFEEIVERGFAIATAYAGDLAPDHPDRWHTGLLGPDVPRDAGAIAAWAWGLSRMLDRLGEEPEIDASRVGVFGHSRLGKAALWAAAQDERFALVISNESGCMGAAITRRRFGETLAFLNTAFPHWMAPRFHAWSRREDALPVDQHQLLALAAPRPLYVASARGDVWADPRGEFLALREASHAWRLLGAGGLEVEDLPDVDRPILGTLGHHLRRGGHDLTAGDWARFLDFADLHLGPR